MKNLKLQYKVYKLIYSFKEMAEQYSVQAENLMKTAVEEYIDVLKDIKATDANLAVIRNIRIPIGLNSH